MFRRTVLVALAASAALVAGPAAASAATPAGLANPPRLGGATDLGAATGQRHITLVLASRDPGGLAAFLADPHHPILTPAAFASRFGPSSAALSAARRWARIHRLTVTSVSANRTLVAIAGSAPAVGSALGTALHRFRTRSGARYVTTRGAAHLPASLAGSVRAVLGLSDLGRSRPAGLPRLPGLPALTLPHPHAGNGLSGYGPQDLAAAYNAPGGQTGAGQTTAVIAEGDLSQPRQDLAGFRAHFNLAPVTWNQINVGTPSSDTSGNDEWDLDTQYSTGLAPGVQQVNVYVAPSLTDPDIVAAVNRWVTDRTSTQASFSAGECELLAQAGGFTAGLDAVLAQAEAQGQTLFTSSGDTGAFCPAVVGFNGVPLGIPGPNYPASSPHAIGVGGTTLPGAGLPEVAWYGSGGGTSLVEPVPAWQAGVGGSFTGLGRGVPDVSLDADPLTGYLVDVGGTFTPVGGTSASAPAWQGIWARAQGAHGDALGFAGPVLYRNEPASAFRDILVGTNVLFPVTPGWDYVTGRGSADISAIVNGA